MNEYVLAYIDAGKKPESPEEGAKQMQKWKAWVDGLGDAVVNPGTPLKVSKTVTSDGVADTEKNRVTGFSIVKAENMDAAVEVAKGCPYLEMGPIEVGEVAQMG